MDHIYVKARAKINLALDILTKRPDGYHEMQMIMQTLSLYDGIFLKKIDKPVIKMVCNVNYLPVDERNLVYQAAVKIRAIYGIRDGIFIDLNKSIPIAAGLGGGSSDCAATLVGLRKLFQLPLSDHELLKMGCEFGADVPYCLMRGTVLAKGIGDQLKPLFPHPHAYVLLVRPDIHISTKNVFAQYNPKSVSMRPDIKKMIYYIKTGNLSRIANEFCNVLESVTAQNYPVINEIKKLMIRQNALGAIMTGSGPTVFAYFKKRTEAFRAFHVLRKEMPDIRDVFLTKIFNPNIDFS